MSRCRPSGLQSSGGLRFFLETVINTFEIKTQQSHLYSKVAADFTCNAHEVCGRLTIESPSPLPPIPAFSAVRSCVNGSEYSGQKVRTYAASRVANGNAVMNAVLLQL